MAFAVDRIISSVWPNTKPIRIAIVGEAPYEQEVLSNQPFAGNALHQLKQWLEAGDYALEDCLLTNVFRKKALQNDVQNHFLKKSAAKSFAKMTKERGHEWKPYFGWDSPAGSRGYPRPDMEPFLEELVQEIRAAQPNVVLALGAVALWALTGFDKIGTYRGTAMMSRPEFGPVKVLGTYHPYAIIRNWDNRYVAVTDTMKAVRESEYPDIRRREREIWIEPTLKDLDTFYERYIEPLRGTGKPVAYDIETRGSDLVTCFGLSPDPSVSIVVPFVDSRNPGGHYWLSLNSELAAFDWLAKILEDPEITKLTHNGTYDYMWTIERMGIAPRGIIEDTLHMSHALQPEQMKGLGHLGSLYTDASAWKTLA